MTVSYTLDLDLIGSTTYKRGGRNKAMSDFIGWVKVQVRIGNGNITVDNYKIFLLKEK